MTLGCEKILQKEPITIIRMVEYCLNLKTAVVNQDEKEGGLRKVLNFGHTLAHALETITGYKKYTHGEAVVKGIEFVFNMAYKMGLILESYKFVAEDLMKKYDFKQIPDFNINKVISTMKLDKKAHPDGIVFILPSDCAAVKEYKMVDNEILKYFG